jgi:hypothetical protein
MGWVRCHNRLGAWLALTALALQVVLAFGHVHFDRIERAALAVAGMPHGSSAIVQASHQGPAQLPADDDDYCAICASISLVSNSFIAVAPPLPLPGDFTRAAHDYADSFGVIAPRRTPFQSRAPPSA